MQGHTKAALVLLLIGLVSLTGYRFFKADIENAIYSDGTDARFTKGKISIGIDNWIGYYPLCSKEMKRSMRKQGYLLECIDDQADYPDRMKKLDKGELDLAVASVDAYLINAKPYNYSSSIIAVIDESKGGDAIVANVDSISSLDDLKIARNLVLGYTQNSPSEHLIRSIASHFDIQTIKENQFKVIHTDGSTDALEQLKKGQLDVAVLWEPDVSNVLKDKRFKRILGTEDTQQLIVDVLLSSRKFSQKNPEALQALLAEYFVVLKFYRDNPAALIKELTKVTKLSSSQVESLLGGVAWQGLGENSRYWMAEHGLVETIEGSVNIFKDFEDVDNNLIPNGDPYRLINTQPLQQAQQNLMASGNTGLDQGGARSNRFPALSKQQWQRMIEVGTLKVKPVVFASGSNNLPDNSKVLLNDTAETLKHYPTFRIRIEGHTGIRGDKKQNQALSQQRSDVVKDYLVSELNFDQARIQSIGKGGAEPLQRLQGESNRRYASRLKRVEITLLKETY